MSADRCESLHEMRCHFKHSNGWQVKKDQEQLLGGREKEGSVELLLDMG